MRALNFYTCGLFLLSLLTFISSPSGGISLAAEAAASAATQEEQKSTVSTLNMVNINSFHLDFEVDGYRQLITNYIETEKDVDQIAVLAKFLGTGLFYHTTSSKVEFEKKFPGTPKGTSWFSSVNTRDHYTRLYHPYLLMYSRTLIYRLKNNLERLPKILDFSDNSKIESFFVEINEQRQHQGLPRIIISATEDDLGDVRRGLAILVLSGRASYLDRFGSRESKYIRDYIMSRGYDGVLESTHEEFGTNTVLFEAEKWLEVDLDFIVWHHRPHSNSYPF
ncbi:MAG: hypothetical protein HQK53_04225 [Oligoflexia bacterium]|nr:hypothetical protein [Oligoflexia bacterium]